jgi:hypothetical protein
MPKYEVNINYPVKGYELYELEIEASSEEEAKEKAIEHVQIGECEGVTELQDPYYDDMQAYNNSNCSHAVEYDIQVYEIDEEETKDV